MNANRGEAPWLSSYRDHAWQPYTQMQLAPAPLLVRRASGAELLLEDGRKLIDAIGSWWVNIHGHCNPRINAAIARQLQEFEHVIYAGLVHEPALQLSARLAQLSEKRLPRCFFSDNGSTAVEVAMKMAYQSFWNRGLRERRKFVTLGGGYHGDTFGAMAVGARGVFHQAFAPLLFPVHSIPQPHVPFAFFRNEPAALQSLQPTLTALAELLQREGETICALILEPIVQGASGAFNFYPPILLRQIRELCDRHEVLLIADEVFTGCGRLGRMFAFEHAGVWPDLMALSKGLSGGYLPFAATLASEQVFAAFLSNERQNTLFHGHSMTASALGCAAALASLDLLAEGALQQSAALEAQHKRALLKLQSGAVADLIGEVRQLGSVAAVKLRIDAAYTSEFGWRFMQAAMERGALLRPLGDVIYLTPCYNISESQLGECYLIIEGILQEFLAKGIIRPSAS
ncbi:MAG: adenosylmethionine--8-amino-7-oxononanoate transaminase [Leptospirales bacterium]|nr:adenosylmethionine--8-amino-7-oxononanoate transaminase [Leptospirales bacterium]